MNVPKHKTDTCAEADSVLTKLIQKQDPSERLAGAVSASNRVAQQCKAAIMRTTPEITEQEVNLRFIEINYGLKLANKVRHFLAENE